MTFKDQVLDKIGETANIAQFISFAPNLEQRYARVRGFAPNQRFAGVESAASTLLQASPEHTVNVRSFTPDNPKSREFIYGLQNVDAITGQVARLADDGLYTIVNETVDVCDGGVSGVLLGDVIEIAPEDTPRCVEKPGTVSFSRDIGTRLLERVYGFRPSLDFPPTRRVEFSLHPLRRGIFEDHTIIWELEDVGPSQSTAVTSWPNRFSRFMGDKAFGLLVADTLGLPVPATKVVPRLLPPFTFGRPVGTGEVWIRTCPMTQDPGHYTTQRGWCDPFALLAREDPDHTRIASILVQEGVDSLFSGSLVVQADGTLRIEGASGYGDEFMLGKAELSILPEQVLESVQQLYDRAAEKLGPVRMEWVYDKNGAAWIVQIHRGITTSQGLIVHQGEASFYHRFEVSDGIDQLRRLISEVQGSGEGIILSGQVGITSHLGDLLRKAEIPSRIELPAALLAEH